MASSETAQNTSAKMIQGRAGLGRSVVRKRSPGRPLRKTPNVPSAIIRPRLRGISVSMKDNCPQTVLTVLTIGHSNHPLGKLLDLLKQHQIEILVDVRSSPHSGYASQFNKEAFQHPLQAEGIRYLFLGNLIGGRPEDEEFYDDDGYVLYDRLAQSPRFQEGITRLMKAIQSCRAALLCSEEDPTNCHRRLLVGRVLREAGVRVLHIRSAFN